MANYFFRSLCRWYCFANGENEQILEVAQKMCVCIKNDFFAGKTKLFLGKMRELSVSIERKYIKFSRFFFSFFMAFSLFRFFVCAVCI